MIKAILFDFDMTLVDSKEVGKNSLLDLKRKHHLDIFPLKQLWQFTHEEMVKKVAELNNHKLSWQEISELNKQDMRKNYSKCSLHHPELLPQLKNKNIVLSIISNNSAEIIRFVLEKNGSTQYFTSIYGMEDLTGGLDKADIIKKFLKENKLKKTEVIYIGDTPSDMVMAKKAGVIPIAVTTGVHSKKELSEEKPKKIINSIKDLLTLL